MLTGHGVETFEGLSGGLFVEFSAVAVGEGWERSGTCPYHLRSSVLGATSLSQISNGASVGRPRGQSRSTRTGQASGSGE